MENESQAIKDVLLKRTLDVRKTHDATWIDQKCTPDIISSVANILIHITKLNSPYYVKNFNPKDFTNKDVWHQKYSLSYVTTNYGKPNLKDKNSRNEYNKFFLQPLNLFSYAGILKRKTHGNTHHYKILNRQLLKYVNEDTNNALDFLLIYIKQVLKCSGLLKNVNTFFNKQKEIKYPHGKSSKSHKKYDNKLVKNLKDNFVDFCNKYTHIGDKSKGKAKKEPNRILPKIINPLAFHKQKLGLKSGYISESRIPRTDLSYTGRNFRDVGTGKPKNTPRKPWEAQSR